MGTDIHMDVQTRQGNEWVTKLRPDIRRSYLLFAWLGNVRNGFGFAGVRTFSPLKPLSDRRGFPEDYKAEFPDYDFGHRYGAHWSNHSESWLHLSEILTAESQQVTQTGIVGLEQFLVLGGKPPESWSGGVWGPDVHVDPPETIGPHTTHVEVSWGVDVRESLPSFLAEVEQWRRIYGPETRIVFGFDS
jgi:hypothetical protein